MPARISSPLPRPPIEQRRSAALLSPSVSRQNSLESSPGQYRPPSTPGAGHYPIDTYREYLDAIRDGIVEDVPRCPRQDPTAGCNDWLTLPRSDDFNVCPTCYDAVFGNTDFRHELVPAPLRPRDKEIACDLGTAPWYRIAWFLTQKHGLGDLRLLKAVADGISRHRPCAGEVKASRTWHSIRDSYAHMPLQNFDVCAGCVRSIEALFPNLTGVFELVDAPGESPKAVCALRFSPNRRRFLDYFEVLELVSNKAAATDSVPDIELLADKLLRIANVEECTRDCVVEDKNWYFTRVFPGFRFTVCKECFGDVVVPKLETSAIASSFNPRPQRFDKASCQLYSQRMRGIFQRACQRNDLDYLKEKLVERRKIELDIRSQLKKFERRYADDEDAGEVKRLVEEWRNWE